MPRFVKQRQTPEIEDVPQDSLELRESEGTALRERLDRIERMWATYRLRPVFRGTGL